MRGRQEEGPGVHRTLEWIGRNDAGEAIARARSGDGPTLIEAKTYRFRGHEEGDEATYRTAEELDAFLARDPIKALGRHLTAELGVSEADLEAVSVRAAKRVEEAYRAAGAAPWPEPSEVLDDVYVSY